MAEIAFSNEEERMISAAVENLPAEWKREIETKLRARLGFLAVASMASHSGHRIGDVDAFLSEADQLVSEFGEGWTFPIETSEKGSVEVRAALREGQLSTENLSLVAS